MGAAELNSTDITSLTGLNANNGVKKRCDFALPMSVLQQFNCLAKVERTKCVKGDVLIEMRS